MKLLITSVGSLLGQNILDLVETRRHTIQVVGLNYDADNPRLFRCDKVYKVPLTESPVYSEAFKKIITLEKPDIILPGRDGDSIFLCEFKQEYPNLANGAILMGNPNIPITMLDKYKSFLLSKEYDLPFAESFYYQNESDEKELITFIEKFGFPLVVKPKTGFGSHDVFFILNKEQLYHIMNKGAFLIQEFLGDVKNVMQHKNHFKNGIPLFFQVHEDNHYAAQIMISEQGKTTDACVTKNQMVHGRAEFIEQINNEEIVEIVKRYSKIFYQLGWYGPTNFQLKKDRHGNWKVFEFNSRLTGTSSARRYLGFDEFEQMMTHFKPHLNIGNTLYLKPVKKVYKYLTDYELNETDVKKLEEQGFWKRY